MNNGISYKTIQKNKTLGDFVKEEEPEKRAKPSIRKNQ